MRRKLRKRDIPAVKKIYEESGFDFEFPDLTSKEFESVWVELDGEGNIIACAAARKTVEIFGFFDKHRTSPYQRWNAVKGLHIPISDELYRKGYKDVHAFLPPEIADSFGEKRLMKLGWKKALWTSFFRYTKPVRRWYEIWK